MVIEGLENRIIKSVSCYLLAQFFILVLYPVPCFSAERGINSLMKNVYIFGSEVNTVKDDYIEFYSRKRLLHMLVATGTGAMAANTGIDQQIQDWYQDAVRSPGTNHTASVVKQFGNYQYAVPLALVSALAGNIMDDSAGGKHLGTWGRRMMRAYLLGFPLQIIAQPLTGGSRPEENMGSDWRPFQDSNGVSGHAFVGAVPFLTLARMNDDNPYLKYFFYAASTLTALSRINDNAHYLSQAALGWYIAWEATDTVAYRDGDEHRLSFGPALMGDTMGWQAGMRW